MDGGGWLAGRADHWRPFCFRFFAFRFWLFAFGGSQVVEDSWGCIICMIGMPAYQHRVGHAIDLLA